MTTRNAEEKLELFQRFFQRFPEFLAPGEIAQKRRLAMLPYLNTGFKVTRGKMTDVIQAAEAAIGDQVPRATVSGVDSPAIRNAASYLDGKGGIKSSKIAQALKEEGIEKWDDLETRLTPAPSEQSDSKSLSGDEEESAVPSIPETVEEASLDLQLQAYLAVVLNGISGLADLAKRAQAELETMRAERNAYEARISALGMRVDELTDQVRRGTITGLAEAAAVLNDPKLFEAIDRITRATGKPEGSSDDKSKSELPAYSTSWKCDIAYQSAFYETFGQLLNGARDEVRSWLLSFAKEGDDRKFQTRKLTKELRGTPSGSLFSRAGASYRFSWKREKSTNRIVILNLFSKDDSSVQRL